jgi:hypothetical protein
MRLTWRDGLATAFVGVATLMYFLWLAGIGLFGFGARGLGGVVLGLGVAASVTAVVYGVGAGLLQASKVYLGIASLIGLVALVAGVITLVSASEPMLGVLVVATVALWVMATVRHAMIAGANRADDEATASQHFADAA